MVPRAGLEPAQRERRGILNPLCLPIPPPGHAILYCDDRHHRRMHFCILTFIKMKVNVWSDTRGSRSSRLRRDLNLGKSSLRVVLPTNRKMLLRREKFGATHEVPDLQGLGVTSTLARVPCVLRFRRIRSCFSEEKNLERHTRFELVTSTLARLRSTS